MRSSSTTRIVAGSAVMYVLSRRRSLPSRSDTGSYTPMRGRARWPIGHASKPLQYADPIVVRDDVDRVEQREVEAHLVLGVLAEADVVAVGIVVRARGGQRVAGMDLERRLVHVADLVVEAELRHVDQG